MLTMYVKSGPRALRSTEYTAHVKDTAVSHANVRVCMQGMNALQHGMKYKMMCIVCAACMMALNSCSPKATHSQY